MVMRRVSKGVSGCLRANDCHGIREVTDNEHLTLTSSGTYRFRIPKCSDSNERAMHNAKRYKVYKITEVI